VKRLLVIRLGALGDLIHMSPSLEAVKAAYPQMEIHLLTSPAYPALVGMMPAVDRVWIWDKRQGWAGLFQLASQLRSAGIDGVVNLHPSFKTWLLTQLLGSVKQAVYHKEKLRQKGQAQRAIPRRHAVADFYEPFRRLLGLPLEAALMPRLSLAQVQEDPLKRPDEIYIGLIPGVGAKRSNRAWEPDAYTELMQTLLEHPNVRILLIGGPDEKALAARLADSLKANQDRLENHCGVHDIPGTARLLTQCDLVIGGDTGPMHLAAAVGSPLVGIYGPTALNRTGPMAQTTHQWMTPPESLACWPCELAECPYTGESHLACMKQIPVQSILEASWVVLEKRV
jgi:ADP-heptose:LPS heptosyltransferase